MEKNICVWRLTLYQSICVVFFFFVILLVSVFFFADCIRDAETAGID